MLQKLILHIDAIVLGLRQFKNEGKSENLSGDSGAVHGFRWDLSQKGGPSSNKNEC